MEPLEARIRPRRRPTAARVAPEEPAASVHEHARWTDDTGSWQYVRSRCARMQALERRALRVAPSDETVLILGETGVGKDQLAHLIHQNSSRRARAFVHLNCAALPEGLLEPELFGHVRGSYTGATETRPGQFEVASGGTLFLDEIGELPPRLQAKLLHVLQERKIYRVGGRQPLDVDVRILAATNRDLTQAIRSGAFRRDLFYRLSVVTLSVPPLRERLMDLDDLALYFFERYAGLYNHRDLPRPDASFFQLLRSWRWDGNIRELENAIKRVILLGGIEHLAEELSGPSLAEGESPSESQASPTAHGAASRSLKDIGRSAAQRAERQAILGTLTRMAWNRKKTARELQVSYRSLLYKIKDYTLSPGPVSEDREERSISS